MGLRIRFLDGPKAGKVLPVDPKHSKVVLGRDPARCTIAFPADETAVGREHCALRRTLDRYRLVISGDHLVLVDGQPARDGQELGDSAELQLGPDGPRLIVETLNPDSRLPPTDAQGPRDPGTATVIGQIGRSVAAHRTVGIVIGSALLVLSVAGALLLTGVGREAQEAKEGLARTEDEVAAAQRSVESAQRSVEEAKGRVEHAEERLEAALLSSKEAMGASLALQSKFERLQAEIEKGPPDERLAHALEAILPSVYLVVYRDSAGLEAAVGTAWVAADGLLATNAHVVSEFAEWKRRGGHVLARSNGSPVRDYDVQDVLIHPGYGEWSELVEDRPVRVLPGERLQELEFVHACDVALMVLGRGASPGAAIPIAATERLNEMKAGRWVGFVGYPMENVSGGGVNLGAPTPTTQKGIVTAVTDFVLGKGLNGERHLIHSSLPVSGGASGSPLLDEEGRVVGVLCAGTVVGVQGTRILNVAGISYAQRSDLVRELLEVRSGAAKLTDRQRDRRKNWESALAGFSSAQMMRTHLDTIVGEWWGALGRPGGRHDFPAIEGELPADGRNAYDVPIGRRGNYLFVALAVDPVDVDLGLLREGAVLSEDLEQDSWPSIPYVAVSAPERLVLLVSGPPGAKFRVHVYFAP